MRLAQSSLASAQDGVGGCVYVFLCIYVRSCVKKLLQPCTDAFEEKMRHDAFDKKLLQTCTDAFEKKVLQTCTDTLDK